MFCGTSNGENGPGGSTINYAESVVEAIALTEGINPRQYVFYDLQTQAGYQSHKPGQFSFNRLSAGFLGIGCRPCEMGWTEGYCEEQILEDFSQWIWGDGPRGELVNLPVLAGALPDLSPAEVQKGRVFLPSVTIDV